MNDLQKKIGAFAAQVIMNAKTSGLSWDETVAAMGIAAKSLALEASNKGDGTEENCVVLAKKRFDEAVSQNVRLVLVCSDIEQLRDAYSGVDAKDIIANTNICFPLKH